MSASLDGFLARGVGSLDWLTEPGEVADAAGDARHAANLELIGQVGEIVLGRGAYNEMAPAKRAPPSPTSTIGFVGEVHRGQAGLWGRGS